jgi:methylenetetrahydrofolate reductase (NADPH)
MDTRLLVRYLERLEQQGIRQRASFLIGIAPLASANSARWIRAHLPGSIIPDALIERLERAADPKLEGRRICVELLRELAQLPGVAGAHVMAPLNESAIAPVVQAFRG